MLMKYFDRSPRRWQAGTHSPYGGAGDTASGQKKACIAAGFLGLVHGGYLQALSSTASPV
jgi:hypothetical protein